MTTNTGNWIREDRKYRFQFKCHIGEDYVVLNKTAKVGDLVGFQEGYRTLDNEVDTYLLKQEIIALKNEKLFHVIFREFWQCFHVFLCVFMCFYVFLVFLCVFMCFYVFLCVFMCFYVFLCVFMCFYELVCCLL